MVQTRKTNFARHDELNEQSKTVMSRLKITPPPKHPSIEFVPISIVNLFSSQQSYFKLEEMQTYLKYYNTAFNVNRALPMSEQDYMFLIMFFCSNDLNRVRRWKPEKLAVHLYFKFEEEMADDFFTNKRAELARIQSMCQYYLNMSIVWHFDFFHFNDFCDVYLPSLALIQEEWDMLLGKKDKVEQQPVDMSKILVLPWMLKWAKCDIFFHIDEFKYLTFTFGRFAKFDTMKSMKVVATQWFTNCITICQGASIEQLKKLDPSLELVLQWIAIILVTYKASGELTRMLVSAAEEMDERGYLLLRHVISRVYATKVKNYDTAHPQIVFIVNDLCGFVFDYMFGKHISVKPKLDIDKFEYYFTSLPVKDIYLLRLQHFLLAFLLLLAVNDHVYGMNEWKNCDHFANIVPFLESGVSRAKEFNDDKLDNTFETLAQLWARFAPEYLKHPKHPKPTCSPALAVYLLKKPAVETWVVVEETPKNNSNNSEQHDDSMQIDGGEDEENKDSQSTIPLPSTPELANNAETSTQSSQVDTSSESSQMETPKHPTTPPKRGRQRVSLSPSSSPVPLKSAMTQPELPNRTGKRKHNLQTVKSIPKTPQEATKMDTKSHPVSKTPIRNRIQLSDKESVEEAAIPTPVRSRNRKPSVEEKAEPKKMDTEPISKTPMRQRKRKPSSASEDDAERTPKKQRLMSIEESKSPNSVDVEPGSDKE